MQSPTQDQSQEKKSSVHPAVPEEVDPDEATVEDPQRGERVDNKPETRIDRTVDAPGG